MPIYVSLQLYIKLLINLSKLSNQALHINWDAKLIWVSSITTKYGAQLLSTFIIIFFNYRLVQQYSTQLFWNQGTCIRLFWPFVFTFISRCEFVIKWDQNRIFLDPINEDMKFPKDYIYNNQILRPKVLLLLYNWNYMSLYGGPEVPQLLSAVGFYSPCELWLYLNSTFKPLRHTQKEQKLLMDLDSTCIHKRTRISLCSLLLKLEVFIIYLFTRIFIFLIWFEVFFYI